MGRGFRASDAMVGFCVWRLGLGFRVLGLGFRGQGLVFGLWGLGLRIQSGVIRRSYGECIFVHVRIEPSPKLLVFPCDIPYSSPIYNPL